MSTRNLDADVVGLFREETVAGVHVFMVREGRIINSNEFVLDRGKDVPDEDLLHMFLLRYYDATTSIPHEVILRDEPEDKRRHGGAGSRRSWPAPMAPRCASCAPQKGEKAELVGMAETNAKHTLMRYKVRTNYDDKRINNALLQLESALALDEPPMRIECFDISTIHGSYTVASMVVFTNGKPDKNQYRRFKIKTPLDEANDFLSMQEVMSRRYAPERMADERFGIKARPHHPRRRQAAALRGARDVRPDGHRRHRPCAAWPSATRSCSCPGRTPARVVLPSGSASLYLVKQVRDEAHRFAITFHRELRGKGMTASILDDVTGMGPVRKKALLKHFKSFRNLKSATLEEIKEARVVPNEVAEELFRVLQQYNRDRKDERVVGGEAGRARGPWHVGRRGRGRPKRLRRVRSSVRRLPARGHGTAATWSPAVDEAVRAAVQGREPGREDNEGRTIA